LQVLAELGVGWQLRVAQADEDAKVTQLRARVRKVRNASS
jgi:hypothetical protein